MRTIRKLEEQIARLFKRVPQLPDSSREALVDLWPWIALLFGSLQLLAAWALINLLRAADWFVDYGSHMSSPGVISGADRVAIYLGISVLIVDAMILLFAYPRLKKRRRKGWELLFLGSLLNIGYSVISLFIHGRGLAAFTFSLISSAVGFYLLYQVRDKYGTGRAASSQKFQNTYKITKSK